MSNQWTNPHITNNLQWSSNKPTNPIDGDTYYDSKINRVFTYSKGNWVQYQLYIPDAKNETRMKKIRNLLK